MASAELRGPICPLIEPRRQRNIVLHLIIGCSSEEIDAIENTATHIYGHVWPTAKKKTYILFNSANLQQIDFGVVFSSIITFLNRLISVSRTYHSVTFAWVMKGVL